MSNQSVATNLPRKNWRRLFDTKYNQGMSDDWRNSIAKLVQEVRFVLPVAGGVLFAFLVLTFKDLGNYQKLVPILVVYILVATWISWVHTSLVYLVASGRTAVWIVAAAAHVAWIILVACAIRHYVMI